MPNPNPGELQSDFEARMAFDRGSEDAYKGRAPYSRTEMQFGHPYRGGYIFKSNEKQSRTMGVNDGLVRSKSLFPDLDI